MHIMIPAVKLEHALCQLEILNTHLSAVDDDFDVTHVQEHVFMLFIMSTAFISPTQ